MPFITGKMMTLEDLVSWISDDLRNRDLDADDYFSVGKALIDIVLATPPEEFEYMQ